MARKINFKQTQTIREAYSDFLLQKKALGLADKTLKTYCHHFDIISKYQLLQTILLLSSFGNIIGGIRSIFFVNLTRLMSFLLG